MDQFLNACEMFYGLRMTVSGGQGELDWVDNMDGSGQKMSVNVTIALCACTGNPRCGGFFLVV